VISPRLHEAAPGKSAVDENVRPEGSGSGLKEQRARFDWTRFGPLKEVAKVLEEDARPRLRLNQQTQIRNRRFGLFQQ
jgi:hypothetical protein